MNKTYSSLGFDIEIPGLPSTVAEFDEMAKREGACLEHAINNYVAHSHLTKVRAEICKAVEKETGIERETEDRDDGKTVYTETENTYIKRVDAALATDGESLEGNYLDAIKAAAEGVEVDLTKTVRAAGATKLAQKWLDKAQTVVDAGKAEAYTEAKGLTLPEDVEDQLQVIGNDIRQSVAAALKQAEADAMSV